MKIQLLIALDDGDYRDFLSLVLSEKYADTFAVTVCSSLERLRSVALGRRFDLVLMEPSFAEQMQTDFSGLKILLWDGMTPIPSQLIEMGKVRKYQRISSLVSDLLEHYAFVSDKPQAFRESHAKITVSWSPIGGSGKTTVALAYAAQRVSEGKSVLYLDLQAFTESSVYFSQSGKSISTVLERMDGNLPLLIQSIVQRDSGSGISYFCGPTNYDDIAILSEQDVRTLVDGCAACFDEVIIDLSCAFDERSRTLLDMADSVLLVIGPTATERAKWSQFRTQNNVFDMICSKTILVMNNGAKAEDSDVYDNVALPQVQSGDPIVVYKTLSVGYFHN